MSTAQPPAMRTDEAAIRVVSVSKSFATRRALDRLELVARSGRVTGLLGPNGAGKTTTLRCLLGLVEPDEGSVSVLGLDPCLVGAEVRRSAGVVLERDGLYGRLSAWENLAFFARIFQLDRRIRDGRFAELLQAFSLWERRHEKTGKWSRGMRQRLAIARALLPRPRVLLLDEPFSGLDPLVAAELRQRLQDVAREGVTVLVATHELAHAEIVCDEVVVMQAGRAIAAGSPRSLSGEPGATDLVIEADGLADELLRDLQRAGVLTAYERTPVGARVRCPEGRAATLSIELARRGVAVRELRRGSLENAFVSLVSGRARS